MTLINSINLWSNLKNISIIPRKYTTLLKSLKNIPTIIKAITKIINHPLLKDLPFILETPNDLSGYKKEIDLLRSLYK